MALRVGITGQHGFIGTYLFYYLKLRGFEMVHFQRDFFEDSSALDEFVRSCEVIIHTAAVNRHEDQEELKRINIGLVEKLIKACENAQARPSVIFTSSIQEDQSNVYGKSKLEGWNLLKRWAKENDARAISCVIPSVFGPFAKPFYNSVIATFCYQLANNETPEINIDGNLDFIYVDELAVHILKQIKNIDLMTSNAVRYMVPMRYSKKVSELLKILKKMKTDYLERGVFPDINGSDLHLNLFNTFLTYVPKSHYPVKLFRKDGARSTFFEAVRTESSGQSSYSLIKPGATCGNNFHTKKIERFIVISGKARIEVRPIGTTDKVSFLLDGSEPSYVDMPIGNTHNITNIGDTDLITLFWTNEPYNKGEDAYHDPV